jgi:hypothetical protein
MNADSPDDHATARWIKRQEAHSRHVLSTAKMVVVFSAPIAAALVVPAMQATDDPGCLDDLAAALLFIALGFTFYVLSLRLPTPKLGLDVGTANKDGADTASRAHYLMLVQVVLTIASSGLAASALLKPDWFQAQK